MIEKLIASWQHLPENINPVFLHIGPLQIRYYGLMYLTSFLVGYFLLLRRIKKEKFPYTPAMVEDFMMYAIMGAIFGARLGYVLFYDFAYFVQHPLEIIWPFHSTDTGEYVGLSGLSFHGGLAGVFVAGYFFCKKYKVSFWQFADFVMPVAPLGYTFGLLGNFFNGELYGRPTDVWWGMYFPSDLTFQLRHPSQLYEAFFEGIVLFVILWSIRNKKLFDGFLFWMYLIGYGLIRFCIEFFRQPDEHLGFIFLSLSMGQVLCLAMVIIGFTFIVKNRKKS